MKFSKNILLLTLLLSTASAGSVKACGCLLPLPRDFFQTITEFGTHTDFSNDTLAYIVTGEVIAMTPDNHGVLLKILHKYHGRPCPDTVTIWGSNGIDCRFSPQSYYHTPDHDTVIVSMAILTGMSINPGESNNDFMIGMCGYPTLRVRSDSVFGGGFPSFTSYGYPLDLFEDSLNHVIQKATGVGSNPTAAVSGITTYPNPATDEILIRDAFSHLQEIILADMQGKVICQMNVLGDKAVFPVKNYPPGLYLLRIKTTDGGLFSHKVLIH